MGEDNDLMIDARYLVNKMKHIPKFEPKIVASQFTAHFFSFSDILLLKDPTGQSCPTAKTRKDRQLQRLPCLKLSN